MKETPNPEIRRPVSGATRWRFLPLAMFFVGLLTARAGDAVSCAGVTEAVVDVTLSLPVPGIVTLQKFKEGDSITTNDTILQLDSRLEELEAERYRLVMENKQADWEGTRKVFDKTSSVSRDELLKKEVDYRVAAAEYQIALEQLARRKLVSPAPGVIAELKPRVGEACSAYQPIARIVDPRHCFFASSVEARAAKRMKIGQKVELEIEDPNTPIKITGTIVFLSPVVDSASGLQRMKAVFENSDGRVRPGLAGRIVLQEPSP